MSQDVIDQIAGFTVPPSQLEVEERYRRLFTHPKDCLPMLIVNTPVKLPSCEERLADPLVMLAAELAQLQPHIELGDDRIMSVRVQFGTAQIAAAFGCEMFVPPDNNPCAGSHALHDINDIYHWPKPSLDAGWYAKLWEWLKIWQAHLPSGVHIQHPDLQSAFNSAHLIRGNELLTDFYDNPDAMDCLLDLVTDFMIDLARKFKRELYPDSDYFCDWGGWWRGSARISNCSMHMIGSELYRKHVFQRDRRFFTAVGGGRVHYCGSFPEVIEDFFTIPGLYGLDADAKYHDFFELCRKAPTEVVLIPTGAFAYDSPELARLLRGDWPEKRNIIIQAEAPSQEEGRRLLEKLRRSAGY